MSDGRLAIRWRLVGVGVLVLLLGCAGPERPAEREALPDGTYLLRASGDAGEAPEAISRDLLKVAARLTRDLKFPSFAVVSHYLETAPSGALAPTIRFQTPIVRSKRRNRRSSGSYAEIDLNRKTVETVVMVIRPYDGAPPADALATYRVSELL